MKNKSQFIFFLVLVLIIAFLSGAAVFWWVSYKNLQEEVSQKKQAGELETYLPKKEESEEPKTEDVYQIDPDELVPIAEEENMVPDENENWSSYFNSQYSFEIKYPDKYKTVDDTYDWEHTLIHFIEVDSAQSSYRGQVEAWDNEEDFQKKYQESPPFITQDPESGKYITINFQASSNELEIFEEWQKIISSFKFIK